MENNKQLVKYKKHPIKKFIYGLFAKFTNKHNFSVLLGKNIENMINQEFSDKAEQTEVKNLLEELLTRNHNLLDTLNIKMLQTDIVDLFGKAKLERIVTDSRLQNSILELSKQELKTYCYILNYNTTNFNERISNLSPYSCKNIDLKELQSLNEKERLKAISIMSSNSQFILSDLNELNIYYEKRKLMCQEIISNPKKVEEEYKKNMEFKDEISDFPFGLLHEMQALTEIDRIKYAIIEAKYGMSLEKATILCNAFGEDIDGIDQSEETRIIKELKDILQETDIEKLRTIDLEEDFKNYEGTINIFPNLKNAYTRKYQETLYQINEQDYIGSQSIKLKGKKRTDVKIYNVLGKNNDRADFNMILTSLGGIYFLNHNYNDLNADWDRQDENHTFSCSYIGNDFLGVVDDTYLLAFSDIQENELLQARNQDAGTIDYAFEDWEDLSQNKFLLPQNQINSSKLYYNEFLVERKVEKDGKLVNRKPNFVVFMANTIEDINDKNNTKWYAAKKLAASLDIPIAVIDGTQCAKLEFDKVQEMCRAVKEEKRMDLIPNILHKIENNRAAQFGELHDVRNKIFSNEAIEKCLEGIVGTIITSDIDTFNQGIKEFVDTTRKIKNTYLQNSVIDASTEEECKSYNYDNYLNRLKILYSTRNGLNVDKSIEAEEKINSKQYNQERDIN